MGRAVTVTLDADGYPDEATLQALREWPPDDFHGAMAFLTEAWNYGEPYAPHDTGRKDDLTGAPIWRLATGGWSGNEDLIGSLMGNSVWWLMYWYASYRGGSFEFVPRSEKKAVDRG